jgi:hypothetical protein
MFDIIAACRCSDKLIDAQQRQVMFELRSFAIGRKRKLAAAPGGVSNTSRTPRKALTVWRYLLA